MTLIQLLSLFLIVMSTDMRSLAKPTKDDICAQPIFDGALAFTEIEGKPAGVHRYLFIGEWVLPYLWDRQQIDWQNIIPISNVFKGSPAKKKVVLAFGTIGKAFIQFSGDDKIYGYKKADNGFTFEKSYTRDNIGFPYISWNVTTDYNIGRIHPVATASTTVITVSTDSINDSLSTDDSDQDNIFSRVDKLRETTSKSMVFFDSAPITQDSKMNKVRLRYGEGSFIIGYSSALKDRFIKIPIEIFPNTLLFENWWQNKIKIPVEFDTYYLTSSDEVVFFKGDTACAYALSPQTYKEHNYCYTFVDTRTIIGCFANEKINSGPEVFPEEPDIDIEPDF